MRTPNINISLEVSITSSRLQKYLTASNGDLDTALKLYEENTRLAEAFYTPLQGVEICLRNNLNARLTARYGADWFQNGAPPFNADSQSMIGDALYGFTPPFNPNDIVAELKFAFWVGLLGTHYDASLWRQCLYRAFLARGGKQRRVVHGRFNAIRRFRNRVMHHEPIFDRPLQQLHDEIIEALDWMCRDTCAWVAHHSRFDAVIATNASPGNP